VKRYNAFILTGRIFTFHSSSLFGLFFFQIGEKRFLFVADPRLPDLISVDPVEQAEKPEPIYPRAFILSDLFRHVFLLIKTFPVAMIVGCKAGESILRGAHLYAVGALGAPPNRP
jgi:hypothetical protein